MNGSLTSKSCEQSIAAIRALDLDVIRQRVMDAELGEGWSLERAESVEHEYRTYLTLLVKHPDDMADIVISKDADEFWHTHILHTLKYTEDCERVFGYYLHHNPHIGPRTPADVQKKAEQVEKMRKRYGQEWLGMVSERGVDSEPGAYCSAAEGGIGKAVYCSASLVKRAAYCSSGSDVVAYCSASRQAAAAYCSGSEDGSGKAAYCSASMAKEPGYCSAGQRPAACGKTPLAEGVAYCSGGMK